jgi:hypothetical protein
MTNGSSTIEVQASRPLLASRQETTTEIKMKVAKKTEKKTEKNSN